MARACNYDKICRILSASASQTYNWDDNGNPNGTGYAIGPNNQISSDGTWTYTFDDEGNLIKKSKSSSAEARIYSYDKRIIWKSKRVTDDGTLQPRVDTILRTVYDGPIAWADIDTSGALTMRYVDGDGIDQRFARVNSSGTVAWYLTDHLGSVTPFVENNVAVIDQSTYYPFGNIIAETNPSIGDRFTYTGREWDAEVGLFYYLARY